MLTIGELAARAGVPTPTVRYYERRGLIAEAPRTPSGYRQYRPETAERLRFIKRAQELGFSLEEVQEFLDLRVDDPASCGAVEARTREKIGQVRQKIRELERMETVLERLVASCEARTASAECPILEMLSGEGGHA